MTDRPDDATLLARYRGGDESAFDALVARWGGAVKGYAIRMLGCRDQAEDIFVETFTRVAAARGVDPWTQRARDRRRRGPDGAAGPVAAALRPRPGPRVPCPDRPRSAGVGVWGGPPVAVTLRGGVQLMGPARSVPWWGFRVRPRCSRAFWDGPTGSSGVSMLLAASPCNARWCEWIWPGRAG
jgi:hypothetical protein